MPFEEVVEAEGHLIDSHLMEQIFDKVVESNGRFEVEQFRIGRTNSEASYLRLKVEAPSDAEMQRLLQALHELGCSAVDAGDAVLEKPATESQLLSKVREVLDLSAQGHTQRPSAQR